MNLRDLFNPLIIEFKNNNDSQVNDLAAEIDIFLIPINYHLI